MKTLPDLIIGGLKINPPIIQGGMGVKVSASNLAAAVADTGAVGTISAALINDDIKDRKNIASHEAADRTELIGMIRKTKSLSKGIIAVNIMLALSSYPALVQAAVQEKVDIIFAGAGIPVNLPKLVKGSPVKIVPIVSSPRVAGIICRSWINKYNRPPDAIVVEGPMAGGHLGFSPEQLSGAYKTPTLEELVVEVVKITKTYEKSAGKKIPVIAAGGIYDGADIARILELGASGVQLGTRFVCTNECDASYEFKQSYLDASREDVTIIKSPVGMPGRAIRNNFLKRAEKGKIKFKCSYRCLKTCNPAKSQYCIAKALENASLGDLDNGFAFAGLNVHRVNKIVPVRELIAELVGETKTAFAAAAV